MSLKSILVGSYDGWKAIKVENSRTEFLDLVNGTKEKYLKMIQSCPQISIQLFEGWKTILLKDCKILPGQREYAVCLFENAEYKGAFFVTFLRNVLVEEGRVTLIVERSSTLEQRH